MNGNTSRVNSGKVSKVIINAMLEQSEIMMRIKHFKRARIIKASLGINVASKYLKVRGYSVQTAVTVLIGSK